MTLVAYCSKCQKHYEFDKISQSNKFIIYPEGKCPNCGGNYSTKIGEQLTSKRSFVKKTVVVRKGRRK